MLPDGLIIERLPVGRANGGWHVSFVCSGVDFLQGVPPRAVHFPSEFRSRVSIAAVTGDLRHLGGGAGGGEDEQEVRMRFADNGVPPSKSYTLMLARGSPVRSSTWRSADLAA